MGQESTKKKTKRNKYMQLFMPAKRMEIKYALNFDVSGRCDSVVALVILTTK